MSETKTILITGGLGYLGSHTIIEILNEEYLKSRNINDRYEIVVADDLSNSVEKIHEILEKMTGKKITFYKIDLCDKPKLEEIFKKHKFYGVIHFAGKKAVNESVKLPLMYYRNNIGMSINLIELCIEYKVNNIIFSSSSCVYGNRNDSAKEDDTNLHPINPYGKTKLYIENILIDAAKVNPDMRVVILRYCNPVAAHPSGEIGENPLGMPNNLFPIIQNFVMGKLKSLAIFGKDYPTRDGTCIRDFLHVRDLAQGHVLALNCFNKENEKLFTDNYVIYNLGTAKGFSVQEVFDAYEKANNIKLTYTYGPRREGDAAISLPNCEKIQKELNWVPTTSLEEMCRDSYNFVKKHPKGIE